MMVSFSQLFKRRGQQGGGREKRRQKVRVKGAGGWRVSNQRILINPPHSFKHKQLEKPNA